MKNMSDKLLKNKVKFVIVSPRQKWGGAICLHALCKSLSEIGYDSRIFYSEAHRGNRFVFLIKWFIYTLKDGMMLLTSPVLCRLFPEKCRGYVDITVKGTKRKLTPFIDKNTIIVYPDVMKGNPLRADKVVRWLLYYSNYEKTDYDENDLFICYRLEFNDSSLNPDEKTVICNYFDLNFYKQTNFGARKGNCYIIRKGRERNDIPEKLDGIVIDNLSEKKKVEVFNQCEYCISYDLQTAYSGIAALCGCKSVIVPEEGKDASYYRNEKNPKNGIAIGFDPEQMEFAKNTVLDVEKNYKKYEADRIENARKFVEYCNNHFNLDF